MHTYVVTHEHRYGTSTFIVKTPILLPSTEDMLDYPDMEEKLCQLLQIDFYPDEDEFLNIELMDESEIKIFNYEMLNHNND